MHPSHTSLLQSHLWQREQQQRVSIHISQIRKQERRWEVISAPPGDDTIWVQSLIDNIEPWQKGYKRTLHPYLWEPSVAPTKDSSVEETSGITQETEERNQKNCVFWFSAMRLARGHLIHAHTQLLLQWSRGKGASIVPDTAVLTGLSCAKFLFFPPSKKNPASSLPYRQLSHDTHQEECIK